MELNKVRNYGNSKVVIVKDVAVDESVYILSIEEYNKLIQGK